MVLSNTAEVASSAKASNTLPTYSLNRCYPPSLGAAGQSDLHIHKQALTRPNKVARKQPGSGARRR